MSNLSTDYLEAAGHGEDDNGALFRPIKNNRGKTLERALTPDGVYKLVKAYSADHDTLFQQFSKYAFTMQLK